MNAEVSRAIWMNKLKTRMLAGVDKFAAAEAAMAAGGLAANLAPALPAEAVEARPLAELTSADPVPEATGTSALATTKVPTGAGRAVRESISLLAEESKVIDELRVKLAVLGTIPNRSEVLRAGIFALNRLSPTELEKLMQQVPKLKPGRPG
ncbi:hypothetical protein [Macromonas bipunctata]|uniref:hypothetical protein n=1 Tax=Macromonas bipunctata TaxID=183670 RepID=UPI0014737444|nr:hypothetical protein [Macromonas bipunctata]